MDTSFRKMAAIMNEMVPDNFSWELMNLLIYSQMALEFDLQQRSIVIRTIRIMKK